VRTTVICGVGRGVEGGVLRACARSIKCDMVLAMPCSPRPRPGLSFSRLSGGCRGLDLGEGRTPCGFVGKVDQCSTPAFLRNQLARADLGISRCHPDTVAPAKLFDANC